MTRALRFTLLAAMPLAACNIQIASPDADGTNRGSGRTRLPAPTNVESITLDGAAQLSWSGAVVSDNPAEFRFFRVYSTRWAQGSSRCDEGGWVVEGTTVSDGFLVGNLQNGVTRCFAVSTVAQDNGEGPRSVARRDTPRHGGRFVVVDAYESRASTAGFLFHEMSSSRIGLVSDGNRADLDFRVERHANGSLWLRPVRSGARVMPYGTGPIPDLSRLDRAPLTGYAFIQVEALPGLAYVFSIPQPDGVHFGAIRVAYVARDHIVIDWAYQIQPGNAELFRI